MLPLIVVYVYLRKKIYSKSIEVVGVLELKIASE